MLADILIPLIVTGLAEFGDKTQLSIFALSSKTKKHLPLLLGVMLAFLIVDGVAVLVGSWIINIVPIRLLKILSGVIFMIFGLLILGEIELKRERKFYVQNPFFSGFLLVFLTEWGDKTQIASGVFATKYDALSVLIGAMTALTLLSAMAIYLAKFIASKVNEKVMARVAGTAFILIGVSFFVF